MRKIVIFVFTLLMVISMVTINQAKIVKAEDVNSCPAFEVDWIKDDGNFEYAGCKNTLDEAKSLMNSDPLSKGNNGKNDYVVRHQSSKSVSKIVAMQQGIVYSYPYRTSENGKNITVQKTVELFQYPGRNNVSDSLDPKRIGLSAYEEMKYIDTLNFNPSTQTGDCKVMCYGFEGYCRYDDADMIPSKYLERKIPIYIGGNNWNNYSNYYISSSPQRFVLEKNYYVVEKNGNYIDLVYKYHSQAMKSDGAFGIRSLHIGKPADFMQEGIKYYSSDGVNFYTDLNEKSNYVGSYYNYYQFVPLRAKSVINSSDFNEYLRLNGCNENNSELWNTGNLFLAAEEKYGINAIAMFGIACNETAFGKDVIEKKYTENGNEYSYSTHNLFNTNAVDSNPVGNSDVFSSVEECINTTASYWFGSYIDLGDGRFFGSHLGNKGSGINVKYAADPTWGMKAASYAYYLDKLHNGHDGNLSNCDKDTLGVITTFNAPLYKEADTNSTVYKTAYYGYSYMKDFTVIIQDVTSNGFTKVVSTNPIKNDRSSMLIFKEIQRDTPYNRDSSYFFVENSDIRQVSNLNVAPNGTYTHNSPNVALTAENLTISGVGYTPGIVLPSSKITTKVEIYKNNSLIKAYNATNNISGDVVNFAVSIPTNEFDYGTYSFKVKTEYDGYSAYSGSFDVKTNDLIENKTIGEKVFKFNYSESLTSMSVNKIDTNESTLRKYLDKLEVIDNKLHVSGLAYFVNVNADIKENISYKLVFENINSDETKEYDLSVCEQVVPDNQYSYKYTMFDDLLDISDLDNGDYQLRIIVNNNSKTKSFIVDQSKAGVTTYSIGDRYFTKNIQTSKNYKIIVSLNNFTIDRSTVKTPSSRTTVFKFSNIELTYTKLSFDDGYSYMRYYDYLPTSSINMFLVLFDNYTGKTYEFNLNNKVCEVDFDRYGILANKINNSCFQGKQIDLSSLEPGTYNLYIKNQIDSYLDLATISSSKTVSITDGKVNLYTNKTNDLILMVEE